MALLVSFKALLCSYRLTAMITYICNIWVVGIDVFVQVIFCLRGKATDVAGVGPLVCVTSNNVSRKRTLPFVGFETNVANHSFIS